MRQFLLVIIFLWASLASADSKISAASDSYQQVDWVEFYKKNQIPVSMAEKKQRVMLQPSPVQFQARLMTKPKAGKFSLAYDALQLWQGEDELPLIDHSAFVGLQGGPVLGVYVTHEAAKMLQTIELEKPTQFYAMHIYNYSRGPRLVIVAAQEKTLD